MAVESGIVSRINFFAENTGYAILQIEKPDFSVFTAVGTMPDATMGMDVQIEGEWKNHPKFGKQFSFDSYKVPEPTGEKGLIAFLSTLKGIKESKAKTIVKYFGEKVLEVLDEGGDKLLGVPGIGPKTLPKIIDSYQKQKGLRKLIEFLSSVGVSASYAARIYRVYGNAGIEEIKRDPYILAQEVKGFGFKRADEVALKMGIKPDSQVRCIAGIMHVLKLAANQKGHCFLPVNELTTEVCSELALPDYRPQMSDIEQVVNGLSKASASKGQRLVVEGDRIWLYSYYDAELKLAESIKQLSGRFERSIDIFEVSGHFEHSSDIFEGAVDIEEWIEEYEQENGVNLASQQKEAVITVAQNGLTVVTGGAGVGKSTISKAIIQMWHEMGKRIVAVAPTGKAAQRIKEATGLMTASTIHRLLGWNGNGFERNLDNPIEADAFLIDEFSMTDLRLANSLFQAIPPHAVVLIVGDVNQLPSVGAGNVLRDVIESGAVPVVRLTQVFRQAATSRIIQASLSINEGKFPELEQISRSSGKPSTDALWINCSADRIQEAISWLLTTKLPEMGWANDDIQVLSPMHKGDAGNIALNQMIQKAWNPSTKNRVGEFREGDRVIQTSNNYDKNVFNGDIGKIESIDQTEKEVLIRFPDLDNPAGRVVSYDFGEMDDLMLAYSISIHKSQGSEFPVIVIPATMQHYMMLQRNLYYTGITRGKKLVVLVGEEKAIQTAVRTNRLNQRNTALASRLG